MYRPRIKELRRAYGFEEVAIVPGEVTINPELANTTFSLGPHAFSIPLIASAMDGVVDPNMAIMMHEFGGTGSAQPRRHPWPVRRPWGHP